MAKLALTWHTVGDDKVCPICRELNGYTWFFDTELGVSELTNYGLTHPAHGLVWSIVEGSNAHGNHRFNCRCSLEYNDELTDLSDLLASAQDLLRALEEEVAAK